MRVQGIDTKCKDRKVSYKKNPGEAEKYVNFTVINISSSVSERY